MSVVGAALPPGAVRTTRAGLACIETGTGSKGPPVLLVPGFTGSKEDFTPLLPHLPGRHAVALDLPGQHESPGPDDPAAYTVEALAGDVLAVVGELGDPVRLVGHSFGGLVARAAVLADPSAVSDLVLMCSGPAGLTGPRTDLLPLLVPVLEQGGLPAVLEAMDALEMADPVREQVPDELRAFLRARFLASSAAGLVGMAAALTGEPDRVDALAASGVPTLVLHGADDDAWSPALQAAMAARLGADLAVVPGAAHSPAAEAPAPTARALDTFWDGVRQPRLTTRARQPRMTA